MTFTTSNIILVVVTLVSLSLILLGGRMIWWTEDRKRGVLLVILGVAIPAFYIWNVVFNVKMS